MASPSSEAPSAETRQSRFEQSVALALGLWPALTHAVQNNWGGPASADKRAWFAGAVVDAFPAFTTTTAHNDKNNNIIINTSEQQQQQQQQQEETEPDAAYVEELLIQVMLDEFEVAVDDDSAFDVAAEIVRLRGQCRAGSFAGVDRLLARWTAARGTRVVMAAGPERDQETDWDDTDGEDDEEDEQMTDAPRLVEKRERAEPEVDEDGFTKVTRRR